MNTKEAGPTSEADIPEGQTLTPKQVRMVWISIIIMSFLLIVGFIVLVAKIIEEANNIGTTSSGKDAALSKSVARIPSGEIANDIALKAAPGSSVKGFTLDGGRMAVHLISPLGEEIAIVDLRSGEIISRVKVKTE